MICKPKLIHFSIVLVRVIYPQFNFKLVVDTSKIKSTNTENFDKYVNKIWKYFYLII